MTRVPATIVALAILTPFVAGAAPPPPLTSASAHWIAAGHVQLDVSWDGGACEEPGEATVEATEADASTDAVRIHVLVSSSTDVCTMQIVPLEYSGIIAVEPLTTTLIVTVVGPGDELKATGSVDIQQAS